MGRIRQQIVVDTRTKEAFAEFFERKTPMQTFLDAKPMAKAKMIAA